MTADILNKILTKKAQEIASRKQRMPVAALREIAGDTEAPRGFALTLQNQVQAKSPIVIAEIKKASPSKGVIRENFKVKEIAQDYAIHGAVCLSVLTDKDFFQGAEVNLTLARESCPLPVLRKDFMLDPYQIYESRALGADCILLIAAILDYKTMHKLADIATDLGMDVLVEVHNAQELKQALTLETKLLGINNRDLMTFNTSLQTTLTLRKNIPDDYLVVTESGIRTTEDVQLMLKHKVYIFLVGEAFMRTKSPGQKMQELFRF